MRGALLLLALLLLPQAAPPVERDSLAGKVLCGYQGWFSAEGDGGERGWSHWTKNRSKPFVGSNAKIDLWPDVSELAPAERFPTGLLHADGRKAEVFSSSTEATVLRHFQWMRDYGIDGAFVQRFICDLRDPRERRHADRVLESCREGANRFGRVFAVMYDLTGLKAGRIDDVLADWKGLKKLSDDPRYLRHRGKPLVAVWGLGFSDKRDYSLAECAKLVDGLKGDGFSVMIGVPTYWRDSKNDASPDPAWRELYQRADILSPWTVGRFGRPEEAAKHAENVVKPDLEWCKASKLDYLPVVFPGFSWHNMHAGKLDQIPRLQGRFYWSQWVALKKAGASAAYVAMFDEVDEATAIFKCTNDVPKDADAAFVGYEGLPSDFYLKLTGSAGKMLRGEIPVSDTLPR